jgi:hypothetical protein
MKFLFNEHKTSVGFLLSLCLLFTFSCVSAEVSTSDTFSLNEQFSYTKPCINDGNWCSAAATCRYTFYDKDNAIQYNNVLATEVSDNSGSLWQYNITQTETGTYKVDMVCVDGADSGSATLYYKVTGNGDDGSMLFNIVIICLSFGIIILGFSMKDPTLTIFGSFGLYFVSLYTLFNGIGGIKDPTTTWAIGLILLGVAMYISTRSAWELIVD